MPKICPKCLARHGGYAVKCECGCDLSGVVAEGPIAPPPTPAARTVWADFFLTVGGVIAAVSCAGCVLVALVAPVVFAPGARADYPAGSVLATEIGAFVGFFYWGAMFVVFREVRRFRAGRDVGSG